MTVRLRIFLEATKKPQNTLIRIIPAGFRTDQLMNTSLQYVTFTQPVQYICGNSD
jgi:hypothetical protein